MLETLFHFYEQWRAVSYKALRPARPSRHDGLPLPPGNFLMQVAGSPAPDVYLHGGELAADSIRDVLTEYGVPLAGAVLDFGCGCGRVLRRWHDERALQVHGCDYNTDLAGWSRANLPHARIAVNGLLPPAPYRDKKFDLIYALSVLTHLPDAAQRLWMRDLHRILKPGGHLIVSTHGEHYMPNLSPAERRRFEAGQLVVRSARSAGSNLCNTFHPPAYFREKLAGGFDVVCHQPRGARGNPEQDLWLLRRLPG